MSGAEYHCQLFLVLTIYLTIMIERYMKGDPEDQNHGGSSYFHNGKLVDRTAYDEEQIIIVQTNVRCANLTSDTDSTKNRIN